MHIFIGGSGFVVGFRLWFGLWAAFSFVICRQDKEKSSALVWFTFEESRMASGEEKSDDFYAVLGLNKECTATELRNAYKKLALVRATSLFCSF